VCRFDLRVGQRLARNNLETQQVAGPAERNPNNASEFREEKKGAIVSDAL